MLTRARFCSGKAWSFDPEDNRLTDLEERVGDELLDDRRETVFFVIPDRPDCIAVVRLDVVLPVILDDCDRDVERRAGDEAKLLPTLRTFDLARTREAF